MQNADVALVLVLPVLVAAVIGGRWAGFEAAVIAAMTFDFFFTDPYQSLKMTDGSDVVTLVLLAVVGLVSAEVGIRARRVTRSASDARTELQRLFRIAELSAGGGEPDDVVSAVRAELMGMFALDECTFEPNDAQSDRARLGRRGAIVGATLRFEGDDFSLPPSGIDLPVVGRGRAFGRLVLQPGPRSSASAEKRFVAVALADELGVVLAAERNDGDPPRSG